MKLSLMENICGGLPTLKMFLSRFISALKYSGGSADSTANMDRGRPELTKKFCYRSLTIRVFLK
jgi:hypothetical protein